MPETVLPTSDYSIIVMVALVSFATCGLLALMYYAIDKGADRHDQKD